MFIFIYRKCALTVAGTLTRKLVRKRSLFILIENKANYYLTFSLFNIIDTRMLHARRSISVELWRTTLLIQYYKSYQIYDALRIPVLFIFMTDIAKITLDNI